jgi:hypothetical protein
MFRSDIITSEFTSKIVELLNEKNNPDEKTEKNNQKQALESLKSVAMLKKLDTISVYDFVGFLNQFISQPFSPAENATISTMAEVFDEDSLLEIGFILLFQNFISIIKPKFNNRFASIADTFREPTFALNLIKTTFTYPKNREFSNNFLHPLASSMLSLIVKDYALRINDANNNKDILKGYKNNDIDISPYTATLLHSIVKMLYLEGLKFFSANTNVRFCQRSL